MSEVALVTGTRKGIAWHLVRSVPKRTLDALIGKQAIRRIGEQRDITIVIDFLVSRESDFVTGQTIYFGGVS